jgi:hypothetical protein
LDSGRLEAFSDGIFAVAITLLALNLAVPGPGHGPLTRQLADHWPSFAAYLVSFLTIGIIWVNHHTLFKNVAKIDRALLFLNLLLLFFVAAIPFGAIESLTLHGTGQCDRGTAAVASSVRRDNLTGGHDRLDGRGGFAVAAFPAEPERDVTRPNSAPADYLGRRARVWITAMRPSHRRAASQHLTDAVTGGGERTLSQHGRLADTRARTTYVTPASTL